MRLFFSRDPVKISQNLYPQIRFLATPLAMAICSLSQHLPLRQEIDDTA